MWTTSNFRAERLASSAALAAALLGAAACPGPRSAAAPDSPRPAREVVLEQPPAGAARPQDQPVEIRSARPLAVRGDTLLERLAGREFLQDAPRPVAIEVITAEPIGDADRTASLEIYLNGELVGDTWPLPPNRLVAFVRDARRLRERVSVTVAWLGDEERTRSRRPVLLTDEQLRPFR